ncbi:hypothetical protein COU78_00415 [Candidatus Peregrinibacteria bacterium CG10_big_fil_rev_8_21_14_0_10_49_24]|nr:MAG: hypothetical protein COV83_06460 [Candidatus Peregrinibacteria bacterium CG11_big_fil_rev_8_21_14_0_20_49_14]PIR51650.1 MAG: hypothetical protein COU78_00415 [Candidatus Peregrinibacteria bacterium CG10_big_fil_rev_8_21_14_0_10_49_24]PJA67990.1 MAG: hypothetical protein CO157_01545 [Candidatus Peregrinibacteria bacterium CG_4_9_14_3_um_filter_49_12]
MEYAYLFPLMDGLKEDPVPAIVSKILGDQESSSALLNTWLARQEGETFESAAAAQERIDTIIALVSNAGFDLIINNMPATIYVRERGEKKRISLEKKSQCSEGRQTNLGSSKFLPPMSVRAKSDVRAFLERGGDNHSV